MVSRVRSSLKTISVTTEQHPGKWLRPLDRGRKSHPNRAATIGPALVPADVSCVRFLGRRRRLGSMSARRLSKTVRGEQAPRQQVPQSAVSTSDFSLPVPPHDIGKKKRSTAAAAKKPQKRQLASAPRPVTSASPGCASRNHPIPRLSSHKESNRALRLWG